MRYIAAVSMIFWALTPIRQYKSNYFFYFLLLAIADPINYLILIPLGIPTIYLTNSLSLLIILVLTKPNVSKLAYIEFFLLCLSIPLVTVLLFSLEINFIIFTSIHIYILILFIKISFIKVFQNAELNIYNAMLVLYEAIMITRGIGILTKQQTALAIYLIGIIAQIAIAIFFSIVGENNTKLVIRLKS